MELGKKVYKSTAITTIKVMAVVIIVVLFFNLCIQTFYDPEFSQLEVQDYMAMIKFHLKYPYDILPFIFFIFVPCFYYGFIRGVTFFENGMVINRGLPFVNAEIPYSEIKDFEIIHSKLFMSIKRKDTNEDILFAIKDVDRAVSIFDQNGIQGDLTSKEKLTMTIHTKLIIFFIAIGVAVMLGQSLGLSRFLFRS